MNNNTLCFTLRSWHLFCGTCVWLTKVEFVCAQRWLVCYGGEGVSLNTPCFPFLQSVHHSLVCLLPPLLVSRCCPTAHPKVCILLLHSLYSIGFTCFSSLMYISEIDFRVYDTYFFVLLFVVRVRLGVHLKNYLVEYL
jgi:hypothetical protein